MTISLNKEQILKLLPHREPMLLIDELLNIKIKEHSLSQRDKNLIQTVVLNSMRYKGQIDKIIIAPNYK